MDEKISNMAIMITNEQEKTLVRGNKLKKISDPPWLTEKKTLNFGSKKLLNVGIRVIRVGAMG